MGQSQDIGQRGESIATEYLQQHGFTIRHKNWRFGHKEIDIVAEKNNCLHIIEVKTRSSEYWEDPKDAVVRRKQTNIIEAADAYITQYNINMETQFDIISIVITNGKYEVEYIPEAFSPTL